MNAVVKTGNQIPAHLQGKIKTGTLGNIDSTDKIVPRIKLLQGMSPEVTEFDGARSGEFWHSILNENLGKELRAVPIKVHKSWILWAPRGDDRGILARARDAIHWNVTEGEFKVKFRKDPNTYTWKMAPTVAESGLDQFGSSRPGDATSTPAAALTYEFLWYFPDLDDCALIINTRGSVKTAQRLISMVEAKPLDGFYQEYLIKARVTPGPDGEPWNNYDYVSNGYVTEEIGKRTEALHAQFKDLEVRANDETEEVPLDTAGPASDPVKGERKVKRNAKSKY